MKRNGSVQQRQNHNSINAKSTVDYTIPRLTLHDMVKILASMNLEHLDMIYTPSNNLLKYYIKEHQM